jgi:CHAT domain
MGSLSCRTIEFHRFGGAANLLAPENKYIRTAGWDEVAKEVSPALDHKTFQRNLNMLRYRLVTPAEAAQARATLATEAGRFLDVVQSDDESLLQVDVVTGAAELWAFPFEAAFANFEQWLKDGDSGVIITRRIRGDFSERATQWPVMPRVLFLHATVAIDLDRSLIDEHVAALTSALAPWSRGKDVVASGLLAVNEVSSSLDLTKSREEFKPTHIHILAHGARTPVDDPYLPDNRSWGLRLGDVGQPGERPADIAAAVRPQDDLPVVVTIAACDSGNQANPIYAERSIAQELHRLGVPVVIGSQLPLTKAGSCTFTRLFYQQLLQGEDARVALHAGRVALKADENAGHDWLSLVGYVRLPPEGYAAYLDEVGLRIDLALLDAAQARADALSDTSAGPSAEFDRIEQDVRARLRSLSRRKPRFAGRKDLLNECCGLEASALKRLAELLFVRGLQYPVQRDADWKASCEALKNSLAAYRTAYDSNLQSHWVGVQQLALDAALNGAITRSDDYAIVERAAELAKTAEAHWAYGTLTELALLAPKAGRQRDVDRAKENAANLVKSAVAGGQTFAIQSTRRQINRYIRWWTNANGFFPAGKDLSEDARQVVAVLS